ncbi:MAG: DsbA family oxidoreductase [Sphingobium sp.]
MSRPLRIDFVSDVSCPWCVIGLRGLEEALERLDGAVTADIHFQPFELNPDMHPDGEPIAEHLARKGMTAEQLAASRAVLVGRAAELGFTMANAEDRRVYNTFDAHRLLHWAGPSGRQKDLKKALFESYFTHGESPADPDILVAAAEKAGLDGREAREVLNSGRYDAEVRKAEQVWRSRGINSVPAVVVEGRYLISGGQPPEAFEQALRQIASEMA